jgi:Ribosomal protein S10p/S20e
MINYYITSTSKNIKALKLLFLFCFNKNKSFNLKTTLYKKKKKKKKITVLKSPHVNKTAQAQLEYNFFSTTIKFNSHNASQYLVLLKKIKSKLFSEIKLQTKITINKQNYFQLQNKLLNPKKFTINNFNNYKIKKKNQDIILKQLLNYIKIFDCFGELNLNQNI